MLQWFLRFSEFAEFTEFNESSAPFRENSNRLPTGKAGAEALSGTCRTLNYFDTKKYVRHNRMLVLVELVLVTSI